MNLEEQNKRLNDALNHATETFRQSIEDGKIMRDKLKTAIMAISEAISKGDCGEVSDYNLRMALKEIL